MPGDRYLIVNADDFGQSHGVNRGVIAAHEQGIVTSASLMVRWPAAMEAAAYARDTRPLSVGLHFDFGEWAYRNDRWVALYEVVPPNDAEFARAEVSRQLEAFLDLVGRSPTHLDSHQHAHHSEPVRSILGGLARKLGVPLRTRGRKIRYNGRFYGQDERGTPYPEAISVPGLLAILDTLPACVTELGCHPSEANDLDTMYLSERPLELATLCAPQIKRAIAERSIRLLSFHEVNSKRGSREGDSNPHALAGSGF